MMANIWRTSILGAATLALSGALAVPAAAATKGPPSPKKWIQSQVDKGRALSTKQVEAGSAEAKQLDTDIKALIDDTLDWDLMTRRSLGRSWNDLAPAQRKDFSDLLRQLIEASYRSKMRMASKGDVDKPKKVSIQWQDPEIRGDKADVAAKVKADKTKTFLEFRLTWNGERWRVYDVSIDEVSTVRTYRSQFRKLIADKGFDELMKRMTAKLDDIKAGRAEIGVD